MPTLASDRDLIFRPLEELNFQINQGRWYDFYLLLGQERDAPAHLLEEAIISRGADLLALAFTRGARNELILALQACYLDFRPVLLDPAVRQRYNQQLALHQAQDACALPYPDWRHEVLEASLATKMARNFKFRSQSVLKRAVSNLWDSEYI